MSSSYRFNRFWFLMIGAILVSGLLSGCKCAAPVDSDVGTDSVHASMILKCAGDGTTDVQVELSVGGTFGSAIYLIGGDELEVTTDGHSQSLRRRDGLFNQIFYQATLETEAPGTQVTVSFTRQNYTSAPDSRVILPEDLAIQAPQANDVFSQEDDLTVSWTPSSGDEEVTINFFATCTGGQESHVKDTTYTVSDSGSVTYPVASLLDTQLGEDEACDVTITLVRESVGTLSTAYKGGSITAQREAAVAVKITP